MRVPLVGPLAAIALMVPIGTVAVAAPAAAAPIASVTTSGWTWEVLTGESDLLGAVTPPPIGSVLAGAVSSTVPTLRAPSVPVLSSLLDEVEWTYGSVVIAQPIANGPATIEAVLSGPSASLDVTVLVDGGTAEYTLEWTEPLGQLVGIVFDPAADGYTDSAIVSAGGALALTDVRGWFTGSSTHHSAAWSLSQRPDDLYPTWGFFLDPTPTTVDGATAATVLPATSSLVRGYFVATAPGNGITPPDTWIARVSLLGGAGCTFEVGDLEAIADQLTAGIAAGASPSAAGCLTIGSASGAVGVPLDELLPLDLDPALAITSWWSSRQDLVLVTSGLPSGVTATLELIADEPHLRLRGTPETPGSTILAVAVGGLASGGGVDLIDAVSGEVAITIAPALAPTGVDAALPVALGLGTLGLLALGTLLVVASSWRLDRLRNLPRG